MDWLEALKQAMMSVKAWTDENKVSKIPGKGLSTNDYTTEDKNKVANIADDLTIVDGKLFLAQNGSPIANGVVLPSNGGSVDDGEVIIDDTLSIPGAAADAFVTGSEINEIKKQIEDLHYKKIEVSLTSNVNVVDVGLTGYKNQHILEVGAVVDEVSFKWSTSKTPKTLIFDGKTMDDPTITSYSGDEYKDLNITKYTSWTIKVTDERDANTTGSTNVKFLNGIYYGVLEDGVAIDSAAILDAVDRGLLTKKLQSNKTVTFDKTAAAGQKFAFACPVSYGEVLKFNVGGLDYVWQRTDINFKNKFEYEEPYYVYMNDEVVVGTRKIIVP